MSSTIDLLRAILNKKKDPSSGWDTENKHLIGMPRSVQEDPRTQQSGFLNALCKRCAAIPWTDLIENPRYAQDGGLWLTIEETREDLGISACRMCQLLGQVKSEEGHKYLRCIPAVSGSHFKARLRFLPDKAVTTPNIAHHDMYKDLGILENLEDNLPFFQPSPEFVDLDLVRGWLENCASSHDRMCQPDDTSKLQGMRVIDCETLLIVLAPKPCLYVALSYVWGPPSEFAEEFVFPALPELRSRTIQDAITVTKRLGFRYLWVDRYCINQNSPEHKMQQIRQMGAIYSSAELTIVAAAGNGPNHGLPGIDFPRRIYMPRSEVIGPIAVVYATVYGVEYVTNSTWAHRAWTFQESYLSRRRLFFTSQMLLYVCNEDIKTDIFQEDYILDDFYTPFMLKRLLPLNTLRPVLEDFDPNGSSLKSATEHVQIFSERHLTYASDGLNAFLGVLDQLAGRKEDPIYHTWGVLFAPVSRDLDCSLYERGSYVMSLTWCHRNPCNRRAGFPSWSWAAWDGPVRSSHDEQILVPENTNVRILSPEGSWSLSEYVDSGRVLRDSGSSDAPAELELVQVTTIPVRLGTFNGGKSVMALLQLNNGIDITSLVYLDEIGQSIEGVFVGVVLYHVGTKVVIMIIKRRGDRYERVGSFMFFVESFGIEQRAWDRITGKQITDVEALKVRLERPARFEKERKQTIILV